MPSQTSGQSQPSSSLAGVIPSNSKLKKVEPYWYNYTTMAKGRWLGREILEIVSTEFRDRSMEYYRYALESGVTTINGEVAKPNTIVRNGDRIENIVHRHEPPVTSTPVKIILHDKEREFIVIDKPGSIPIHAAGRYYKQSLIQILQDEFGFERVHPVNRLDRLTSGLMILPLSPTLANTLAKEFFSGQIKKEYIARCKGEFPEGEIVCEEPLLTVDRQMGLNIVHPEGKPAKTVFNRLHYDANTDTSVLHCQPLTGRSHQIRVHLQYMGHPIANDPVYSDVKIWGENLGKGGVDLKPSEERAAPAAPPQFQFSDKDNPESLSSKPHVDSTDSTSGKTPLPRETGHDIGMGSPVPLSAEAVQIITRLRNQKDEDEDWGRWRDVVFRAKGRLTPKNVPPPPPLPPQNRRKRGGPAPTTEPAVDQIDSEVVPPAAENLQPDSQTATPVVVSDVELVPAEAVSGTTASSNGSSAAEAGITQEGEPGEPAKPQLTTEDAVAKLTVYEASQEPVNIEKLAGTEQLRYCPECYLPLHPDPKPEKLYIFLHALRYTTSLGCFETEMPAWAAKGWEWDRS